MKPSTTALSARSSGPLAKSGNCTRSFGHARSECRTARRLSVTPHRKVCVYCGSSSGNDRVFSDSATALGRSLVSHGCDLVYGGGSRGIMRVIADSVLDVGGSVYGVIPQSLVDKEVAHTGLTELHVTTSMHERKSVMADMSDAFIALPGGLGTLEELFETWTWTQLGFHQKPIGLLNVKGYFASLISSFDDTDEAGFVKPDHKDMLIVSDDPDTLLDSIWNHSPTVVDKLAET